MTTLPRPGAQATLHVRQLSDRSHTTATGARRYSAQRILSVLCRRARVPRALHSNVRAVSLHMLRRLAHVMTTRRVHTGHFGSAPYTAPPPSCRERGTQRPECRGPLESLLCAPSGAGNAAAPSRRSVRAAAPLLREPSRGSAPAGRVSFPPEGRVQRNRTGGNLLGDHVSQIGHLRGWTAGFLP
jgi:hypothetical protein